MSRRNEIDMTKGNLFVQILAFSLPLMASQILQLLFNAADIVIVGKYAGDTAMAAVSSTVSIINLIVNFFIGLSVGSNVATARNIGAGKKDRIVKVVHTSVWMSLFFGVMVALIGFIAARPMLVWMDSPIDVIGMSTLYLQIYFLGAPFNMFYNFGAALLRSKGDTKRPLYFLLIAGVLNTALNFVLVAWFNMSVAGVAIATIFSQFVSAVLIGLYLLNDEGYLHVDIKRIAFDKESFMEIITVGLPSGLRSVAFSISNVLIQSSINSFGSVVMAGSGAAGNIEGFVWQVMNSFTQATQAFVSQCYGAYNYKRMMRVVWVSMFYVVLFGFASGYSAWYFGNYLIKIYASAPEAIAAGVLRLSYTSKWYFTCGVLDVMSGTLSSTGKPAFAFAGVFLGCCVFRIIYILTVFKAFPIVENVYITYPLSWVITPIVYVIVLFFHLPKVKKICEENAVVA